jgi:hypothetical protein
VIRVEVQITQTGVVSLLTVSLGLLWFVSACGMCVYVVSCGFIHNRQTPLLGGGVDLHIKKQEIIQQELAFGLSQNLAGWTKGRCSTSYDITQYH